MKTYRKSFDYLAVAMARARQGRAKEAVQALFAAATHPSALETIAVIERSQAHALNASKAASRVKAQEVKSTEVKAEDEDEFDVDVDTDGDGDADVTLDIDVDADDDEVPEEVDSKARAAFAKLLKGMK